MRLSACVLAFLLVVLLVSAQHAGGADPFLVVPGERIGPIRLGMSLGEAVASLGPGYERSGAKSWTDLSWKHDLPSGSGVGWLCAQTWEGLRQTDSDSRVMVTTASYDERYGLQGGSLHIGVPEEVVIATMGAPTRVARSRTYETHSLIYPKISFVVEDKTLLDFKGKVVSIIVSTE